MVQAEYNYELFFDLSPDWFCIAGFDGYFKRINPAVSKVLGYSFEELYSRPINDFVHPEDQTTTAQRRDQLHKAKPLLNFENRYLSKNGEVVWLSWTSMPVEDQRVVFAIAKNITHKKRLEADRNSLLARLTQINEELKQLTYTTSHALRAPGNNLLSTFSLLDTAKITDPETLELVEILEKSGKNLKNTLNTYVDILTERNEWISVRESVNLSKSLNSVLESISALLKSSMTKLEVDFSQFEEIEFNSGYLESILLNLITNSIKYSRPGLSPEIRIFSFLKSGQKQLILEDNGIGFDLEKVGNRIFGLHQKFHDHHDSKGIGLYLVYNHVTRMGGKIEVESQVNEGTRFTITF